MWDFSPLLYVFVFWLAVAVIATAGLAFGLGAYFF